MMRPCDDVVHLLQLQCPEEPHPRTEGESTFSTNLYRMTSSRFPGGRMLFPGPQDEILGGRREEHPCVHTYQG